MGNRLHLVLAAKWYDATVDGHKRIEYRAMSPHWQRVIWERRHEYKHVRFSRGYSKTMAMYEIDGIDIGPCPLPGWDGDWYRIHFSPEYESLGADVPDTFRDRTVCNNIESPTGRKAHLIGVNADSKYGDVITWRVWFKYKQYWRYYACDRYMFEVNARMGMYLVPGMTPQHIIEKAGK